MVAVRSIERAALLKIYNLSFYNDLALVQPSRCPPWWTAMFPVAETDSEHALNQVS